jgi:hypothetical protein
VVVIMKRNMMIMISHHLSPVMPSTRIQLQSFVMLYNPWTLSAVADLEWRIPGINAFEKSSWNESRNTKKLNGEMKRLASRTKLSKYYEVVPSHRGKRECQSY